MHCGGLYLYCGRFPYQYTDAGSSLSEEVGGGRCWGVHVHVHVCMRLLVRVHVHACVCALVHVGLCV